MRSKPLNGNRRTERMMRVWDNYYAGLKHYDQSISYPFFYVDHYERAEFGVQTYSSVY